MSNLSDFLGGGSGGGVYLGYIETADGSFEKIANGAGVAVLDYSSGDVLLSDDGTTASAVNAGVPYFPYSDGLWLLKTPVNREVSSQFPSPDSAPFCLTMAGNDLVSGSQNSRIYLHVGVSDSASVIINSSYGISFGVTFDGINIITGSPNTDLIYVFDGTSSTILNSFSTPANDIRCLAYYQGDLLSYDLVTGLFYIHYGASASIKTTFASPVSGVVDMTMVGNDLVICSSSEIYILDGLSSNIVYSFAPQDGQISGITFDGINLITCSSLVDQIYIHTNLRKFALALTEATA